MPAAQHRGHRRPSRTTCEIRASCGEGEGLVPRVGDFPFLLFAFDHDETTEINEV